MNPLGTLLRTTEDLFGHAWSIGELAVLFSRIEEVRGDPYLNEVLDDIERRGFYPQLPVPTLTDRGDGWLRGNNPYRRLGDGKPDRILARRVPVDPETPSRRLVVVCHCYGVPLPKVMERLFGLHTMRDVDVLYNIMNHHALGDFPVWPGTGFASARLSHFIENLRSAIAGVRGLVEHQRLAHRYDSVTVVGFSIGGQLAMHLSNTGVVDSAVLYCPVTSVHQTAQELGAMRWIVRPLIQATSRFNGNFDLEALRITEPLRYDSRVPQERTHVIAQRHDALTPLHQLESIRRKYPNVRWHEFGGTHVVPAGLRAFPRIIREALR